MIANDIFANEKEQLSDQRIRLGENGETRSARQRFPQGGRSRSKVEVVAVTDLFMESAFSKG